MGLINHLLIVLICAVAPLWTEDYKVVNAQTGMPMDEVIKEPRGAYSFSARCMGENTCGAMQVGNAGDPTSQTYIMNENGVLVIGCTKIRAEYPQDDKMIELKIVPSIEQYKAIGNGFYTGEKRTEHGRLVVWEKNTAAELSGPDALPMVIHSNGFAPKETELIRIDRHFVKDGYYLQIVSFSRKVTSARRSLNH